MAENETEQTLAVKITTIALTFAAGWAAQKAVGLIWKSVTGKAAPTKADDPELNMLQATAFAAVAAGTAVLVRRAASKGAARVAVRLTHKVR
ncbi:DUF4235 domain-containing protein [Antribacter gilvus]|uniref:DUF4235 domain-containing protein n=1 Tax=Antribacter gilvus TaxID=2304675 RepID=UPI000F7789DD|nr:DUF4235 domain-containing protein [Antribacter gilvus]